jgi:hypothetical protein
MRSLGAKDHGRHVECSRAPKRGTYVMRILKRQDQAAAMGPVISNPLLQGIDVYQE